MEAGRSVDIGLTGGWWRRDPKRHPPLVSLLVRNLTVTIVGRDGKDRPLNLSGKRCYPHLAILVPRAAPRTDTRRPAHTLTFPRRPRFGVLIRVMVLTGIVLRRRGAGLSPRVQGPAGDLCEAAPSRNPLTHRVERLHVPPARVCSSTARRLGRLPRDAPGAPRASRNVSSAVCRPVMRKLPWCCSSAMMNFRTSLRRTPRK